MAQLLERPVEVKRIVTVSAGQAMGLEDPARALIVNLLAERGMSVEEIVKELRKRGVRKAPTTVRHHLEVLKGAGLVELSGLREGGGGVLKYFASNTRILGYEPPADFDERLSGAIAEAEEGTLRILRRLLRHHRKAIRGVAESMKDCPYCPTPHFAEYTVLKVLERAMAKASKEIDWGKV